MYLFPGNRFIPQSPQFPHLNHKKASSLTKTPFFARKVRCSFKNPTTQNSISPQTALSVQISQHLSQNVRNYIGFCLSLPLISFPAPSSAIETAEIASGKINVEEILIAIDDFNNRNPFFVAGVTFIWLVVIPLTEGYFKKYKVISALDAFRKLREVPEAQLLDIRKEESVKFMDSPNLKILNKRAIWVSFEEQKEEEFVKNVLFHFNDPQNTVLCIIDNFDGKAFKVAELLHKNGFKEAYAIRGGVRGKDGWLEIQKIGLPPSVAMWPRKTMRATSADPQPNGQETNYV